MPRHLPVGTLINVATVTVGSLIGLGLQQTFPPEIKTIVFQAMGLGTLVLGIMMSLKIPGGYLLNFIFSLVLGGIIGQLLGLDLWLNEVGDQLKMLFGSEEGRFTEGLVTAFLLFCIGSMTIVGAIEEGLHGKRELLLIKSLLDGVTSIAFASTYGIGVLFSVIPLFLFQGGITLLAVRARSLFTDTMIAQLSAVGGALIIGIGINLIPIGDIRVENLLPALLVTLLLTLVQRRIADRKAAGDAA